MGLSLAQRSFIRALYKKLDGCYSLVCNEFVAAFNSSCPSRSEVHEIVSEDKDVDVKPDISSTSHSLEVKTKRL